MSILINSYAFGSIPWTPANLSSLVAWYAADEPSNTIVSGLMDTLFDKSGNGNHAAIYSANTANRGQIYAAAQNGLPTWGYDTSARQAYFRSTSTNALAASNNKPGLTIFAVSAGITTMGSGNPGATALWTTGTSDAGARIQLARGSFGNNSIYGGGRRLDADSLQTSSNSVDFGLDYLIAGCINDYSATSSFVWVNGSAAGSNTGFQSAGNTSATNSQALNIGATGANATPNIGRTGEVIFASTALGTTDRQKLEGYLAWKWGLTGSLPGGHPYKTVPPTV